MSFSMIKTFEKALSTLTSRFIGPKALPIIENKGIHQICSQYPSMLTTTSSQSIFKPFSHLLAPTSFLFNQVCGMKVKGKLQLRCKGCFKVAKGGRMYVMCTLKPRHKQMQMQKSFRKRQILTFAYQRKQRDW